MQDKLSNCTICAVALPSECVYIKTCCRYYIRKAPAGSTRWIVFLEGNK